MSRREKKRLIRRNSIVDIAEAMFVNNGYEETSMEQIAYEAGLTKATVYNYFESKTDILATVLGRHYARMHETIKAVSETEDEGLNTIGNAYLSFINEYPVQSEMLDSGKCVTINKQIIEKEEKKQQLTDSEKEFRANEHKVGMRMAGIIQKTMSETKTPPLKVVKILGSVYPMIRSIVRQGRMSGQNEEDIRDSLNVLFRIIEQGVRHFE